MENGWIKFHRKELVWFKEMTDQEMRYYIASRMCADWDYRHKDFGTFDARTHIVKETMLLDWSVGKINTVKNSLLKRGVYKKTADPRRLALTNARLFLKRESKFETVIQESEKNLHYTEYDIQRIENSEREFVRMKSDLARNKRVVWQQHSAH